MASLIDTKITADALLRKHGLIGWRFEYDNAKRRGGQCRHAHRAITMSRHLVPLWSDAEVLAVLKHEIAHALVGPNHGHDAVWAAKMRELGEVPKRTHSSETVPGRYVAICDTCNKEAGRAHRRTRAMREGRHLHKVCMKPIRWVDTAMMQVEAKGRKGDRHEDTRADRRRDTDPFRVRSA